MRRSAPLLRSLALAGLVALAGTPAAAQSSDPAPQPASLVADSVQLGADDTLIATGHVEVFYQGTTLTASKVVYDRKGDRLAITGPIRLSDQAGNVTLADSADLSADLRDGILRSARIVLNKELQLAATQLTRVGGRYTEMTRTVASSCHVCAGDPTPLWEIRAKRVVHDTVRHQLFFDQATFRVAGIPIMYLPRLRMPDPTLKRATGFLLPKFHNSTLLGATLEVPYFIAIGDSRDLTVTPYISTGRTATVALRYRQAFRDGSIVVNGAVSRDQIIPGATRGYLFANGSFALRHGYSLNFNIRETSDPSYLLDYGFSTLDRLQSDIEITRTRRNDYVSGQVLSYKSLRAGENNATLPSRVGRYTRIHRFTLPGIGGTGRLTFDGLAFTRSSTQNILGRDEVRGTVRLHWRRNWVFGPGIVFSAIGQATADLYKIAQDSNYPHPIGRTIPVGAVELRWPLVRAGRNGATQVLEPIAQLVWAPRTIRQVPNETSTLVQFDEGNLWSVTRYHGYDQTELGPRANVGVSWTRYSPGGWTFGALAGRVFRVEPNPQFPIGSGLRGQKSDWLTVAQIKSPSGFGFFGRTVFDSSLRTASSELRMTWQHGRANFGGGYIWIASDPNQNYANTNQFEFDADWHLRNNWSGSMSWLYDLDAKQATNAALNLNWRNECVNLALSLSRRFTSSTTVAPVTSFGLSVDLLGISGRASGESAYARSCSG